MALSREELKILEDLEEPALRRQKKEEKPVPDPPDFPGLPTIFRTKLREFSISISGKRVKRHEEVVDIPKSEFNLLLYFMSAPATEKLSPLKYVMYQLMWKFWGQIDRKAIFRLLGFPEGADRIDIDQSLAYAIGRRLTDLAVAATSYLLTWKEDSHRDVTRACHAKLRFLVPSMFQTAAILMSNGAYAKNCYFKQAAVIAIQMGNAVGPLCDDQFGLPSTMENRDRLEWLMELQSETYKFRSAVNGIVGSDETTSLLSRN